MHYPIRGGDSIVVEERDLTITKHFGLVEVIIDRLLSKGNYKTFRRLRDDLIGEGMLGLIMAVDTYDPDRGAKLTTYISLKVRGHALDYIRKYKRVTTPEVDIDNAALQRKYVEELSYNPWTWEDVVEKFDLIDKHEPDDRVNRKIYHRIIMGGMTCKELAVELGQSLNSIKKRKKRLLTRLGKEITIDE
jgi:RNA polymerase sigma factor (sigma-70 family)